MSSTRSLPRSRTWLRALVLLLALLVPGTHAAEVRATPVASSAESTVEYDVLDTAAAALRPASLAVHRPTAPLRPAPAPSPASPDPQSRALPAPPRPPHTLRALRTVVLRC
ncbi:hypothetical protein AB0I69_08820 [Streptomyces sp. NPDC050508]|uniref:hypothetical protein n=1 Tax=Streptomyces sp. NPDC050508 TaxID=3155405 RepID=UPI0034354622